MSLSVDPSQIAADSIMDLQLHNTVMSDLISRYIPTNQTKHFDPKNITKEGLREIGLEKIAKDLNQLSNNRMPELKQVMAPQKQLYVMIIGNHSAGKSSFINWYIGDKIQTTRVSIETIEINLIMHGNKQHELQGANTTK